MKRAPNPVTGIALLAGGITVIGVGCALASGTSRPLPKTPEKIPSEYLPGGVKVFDVPRGGAFFRWRPGRTAESVGREWLEYEVESNAINLQVNRAATMRAANLILCGPWNLAMAGIDDRGIAKDAWGPNGLGLGLDTRAVHADNEARMRSEQDLVRAVDRHGKPNGSGQGKPLLAWVPLLNIERLRAGDVTVEGLSWEDDTTVLEPPPEIQAMRIANGVPGVYGCDVKVEYR